MSTTAAAASSPTSHPQPVKISVNERPVTVQSHDVSGLQIKEASITQGLPIQLSFQLSEELGNHKTRVIGDQQIVGVHEGSKFTAVAGDDNS